MIRSRETRAFDKQHTQKTDYFHISLGFVFQFLQRGAQKTSDKYERRVCVFSSPSLSFMKCMFVAGELQ